MFQPDRKMLEENGSADAVQQKPEHVRSFWPANNQNRGESQKKASVYNNKPPYYEDSMWVVCVRWFGQKMRRLPAGAAAAAAVVSSSEQGQKESECPRHTHRKGRNGKKK